jgi:Holliday junction resolvase RusA-like endonuclease
MIDSAKGCGGRGYRYSTLKAQWKQTIALHAMAAGIKHVERARFEFRWVEANRKRDPDNIAAAKKLVFDSLMLAKVLTNDGWKQIAGWTDTFEVGPRPGVEVTIIPVP